MDEGEAVFIFSVAFSDKQWPRDINIKHGNKTQALAHAHTHTMHPYAYQTQDINIIYEHLYAEYFTGEDNVCFWRAGDD